MLKCAICKAKHAKFYDSLNAAQKKIVAKSLPKVRDAASTLGPGVTPEHLEEFMRARAPQGACVFVGNENGGKGG